MHKESQKDLEFETSFFESILRRDRNYVEVIELLGSLYTRQGRIQEGLKMDRRMVKLRPENAVAHYNLACSLALLKKREACLAALREAIRLGYEDYEWMAKDKDFASLEDDPEFIALLCQLRKG
jgi:tetratricopeptide (TPR) repeat protein